eukprot:COSAG06_NODE_59946_length_272_cov_1.179191_2_plen_33_part_01
MYLSIVDTHKSSHRDQQTHTRTYVLYTTAADHF